MEDVSIGTGFEAETMMVASLQELLVEGGLMVPPVAVLTGVTEADPEEKKLSVMGGEAGFQLAEYRTSRKPSLLSSSEESLSDEANAGKRTKRFRVNTPITPPHQSMNQFSNRLKSDQILR